MSFHVNLKKKHRPIFEKMHFGMWGLKWKIIVLAKNPFNTCCKTIFLINSENFIKIGVGCMKVENLKMVQYCWEQFFLVINIITRHKKTKFSKKMHFSGFASHFCGKTLILCTGSNEKYHMLISQEQKVVINWLFSSNDVF